MIESTQVEKLDPTYLVSLNWIQENLFQINLVTFLTHHLHLLFPNYHHLYRFHLQHNLPEYARFLILRQKNHLNHQHR